MDFKDMLYIITIVQEGTLHKAADKLYTTQPSLSRVVINLEKELALKLFDKKKSPWQLTRAGELFLEKSKEILSLKNNLFAELQEFTEGKKGSITLASMPFEEIYLLPKVLTSFKEIHPDFKIDIIGHSPEKVEALLLKNEVDFAIVALPIESMEIEHIVIKEYELLLALPMNHFFAKDYQLPKDKKSFPEIDLSLLKDEQFIFIKQDVFTRKKGFELCEKHGFNPNIALELYKIDAAHAFAKAGFGVTFVFDKIIDYDSSSQAAYFKIKGQQAKHTIAFAYRKDKKFSKIEKDFLTILQQQGF